MKIPFTISQFMEIFNRYNTTVFPMQFFLNLLAVIAIFFAVKKTSWSGKIISCTLSFLWIWLGVVYHLLYFTLINKAAYFFSAAFIFEGILFFVEGVLRDRLSFQFRPNLFGVTAIFIIFYALLAYPVLGYLVGHIYPYAPTFGVPCPTTIFTFAFLVAANEVIKVRVLLIPLLWSLLGTFAAFSMGMVEDVGLVVSAVVAVSLIYYKKQKKMRQTVDGSPCQAGKPTTNK